MYKQKLRFLLRSDQSVTKPRIILFVVDMSGSMTDDGKKEALNTALKYAQENCTGNSKIEAIAYNSIASRKTLDFLISSTPWGGTSFSAALKDVRSFVQKETKVGDEIAVIFMTDGFDGDSSATCDNTMQDFQLFSRMCKRVVIIHTIAFGAMVNDHLLQRMTKIGTESGNYRKAASGSADMTQKMSEIFDFLDLVRFVDIQYPGGNVQAELDPISNMVDVVVPLPDVFDAGVLHVQVSGIPFDLVSENPDLEFVLLEIRERTITNAEELNAAQKDLNAINVFRSPKSQREKLMRIYGETQSRLMEYHKIVYDTTLGNIQRDETVVKRMISDLRNASTDVYSKASRTRRMMQRATANTRNLEVMERRLQLLIPDFTQFLPEELALECCLTGEGLRELMEDGPDGILGFGLRVHRDEHIVDCPTALDLKMISSGVYSIPALISTFQYKIVTVGFDKAVGKLGNEKLEENEGCFRGPNGYVNAFMPMYINQWHGDRVLAQIEPLLGYLFTGDPLGYKGDQMLAMFHILGLLLVERGRRFPLSDWLDFFIEDLRKLCRKLKPKILHYLQNGNYANGILKTDPLLAFVENPKYRTAQVFQSLLTIVGLKDCGDCNNSDDFERQFQMAFTEEALRRAFTQQSKALGRLFVGDEVQKLIGYTEEPTAKEEEDTHDSGLLARNDIIFEEYYFKLALELSKRHDVERIFQLLVLQVVPIPHFIQAESFDANRKTTFLPYVYENHEERINLLVQEHLGKVKNTVTFFENHYPWFLNSFSDKQLWMMTVQALQYSQNAAVNDATEANEYSKQKYQNTWTHQKDPTQLWTTEIDRASLGLQRSDANMLMKAKTLGIVEAMIATPRMNAFIGYCLAFIPTRGGLVFDYLLWKLDTPWKMASEKLRILLLGKHDGNDILSDGNPWVECHRDVAKNIRRILGKAVFDDIENQMKGTHCSHIYRLSDKPNRHGHCNSNPNPKFLTEFHGFGIFDED